MKFSQLQRANPRSLRISRQERSAFWFGERPEAAAYHHRSHLPARAVEDRKSGRLDRGGRLFLPHQQIDAHHLALVSGLRQRQFLGSSMRSP